MLHHSLLSQRSRSFEFVARCSEIIALEWDGVDLQNRRIVWPCSKTGGMFKPMSEDRLLSTTPRREGSRYVLPYPGHPGKHLTTSMYYAGWSRSLNAAGATHVGTQGILHRSATDIANSGIPVKVGMALTAHKTVVMVMRYVHTEAKPARDASELVANRLKTITGMQRAKEVAA